MTSVIGLQRDVQTKWEIDSSGENLLDEHMSKIIKWAVNDFKKKYPLLFTREYNGGRRPDYGGKSYWPLKFIQFIVISIL